jgi:hypothetical protein
MTLKKCRADVDHQRSDMTGTPWRGVAQPEGFESPSALYLLTNTKLMIYTFGILAFLIVGGVVIGISKLIKHIKK